jgi:3-deoxy-D-manno-octulosonic-acid transferase
MLRGFSLIQPQSTNDEARLRGLGALGMLPSGDLKASAPPLPHDPAALEALRHDGKTFVAASTHAGEEVVIAAAHALLAPRHPGLRTIIIPRHPERGAEVAALVGGTRRSLGEAPGPLHVADTLGELGLFYRLADVALVGGSLVPHGGQNPMEPARLGCPILLGPHTGNFQERVLDLVEAGAVRVVEPGDAATLAAAVHDVLSNTDEAQRMAEAAREVAQQATGTADRLADEIVTWLRPAEPSPEGGEVRAPEAEREHQTP